MGTSVVISVLRAFNISAVENNIATSATKARALSKGESVAARCSSAVSGANARDSRKLRASDFGMTDSVALRGASSNKGVFIKNCIRW
jgi:hypothetical protein